MVSYMKVQRALELNAPFLQCDKFFHILSIAELRGKTIKVMPNIWTNIHVLETSSIDPDQGPAVQSTISILKLLIKDSLSLLLCTLSAMLIFFAEKNVRNFCSAKVPHNCFSQKW